MTSLPSPSSSAVPASPTPAALADTSMARREWCQTMLGMGTVALVPIVADLAIEQRQGWLLLASDR